MMSGEGKISLSLGVKRPSKPPPTNGVKRSHASLREDEDDAHVQHEPQTVSHFDKEAGGAVDEHSKPMDEPLIIAPQKNRDWRESSKRRKQAHALGHELGGNTNGHAWVPEHEVKPAPGLHIPKRAESEDVPMTNGHDSLGQAEKVQQQAPEADVEASVQQKQKTDDELAMDALLGKTQKADLTIPAVTEEEAFEQDYHQAPEMATLAEYEKVPVEQFGAAMLRGMGWKEGEGIGSERGRKVVKAKPIERRPALLGIGAKEEAAVAQEMGTWGKAARGKDAKVYNPLVLRDKKTGEMFTEEELERKRQREEQDKLDFEFEQKEKERERRRRKEEDSDYDRKDRSGRRDRDGRDGRDGRDRERDRRKHDDSDEEYYRRKKEKERRRREREKEDSDYDCEHRRRRDTSGERRRHRSRERDRRR